MFASLLSPCYRFIADVWLVAKIQDKRSPAPASLRLPGEDALSKARVRGWRRERLSQEAGAPARLEGWIALINLYRTAAPPIFSMSVELMSRYGFCCLFRY
jgi:hypothetical protein